ncbi:MAG: carbohydrate ABC transporter permease [Spirochaetales bacterium]|nr:carbohydrate ABC transporter permease [Spirochaetales bacterium]
MPKQKYTFASILRDSILILWGLIILLPLCWVLIGSFKNNVQLYENPWGLPTEYHFENFARAWSEAQIGLFFVNSIVVTAFSVTIGVFLSVLAAYVVNRFPYRIVKFAFWAFTASMMLPLVLTLVPKFLIIRDAGLLDSRMGLVLVYVAGAIPFGVFTMESFFASLPKSFEESAFIDGAGPFTTFLRIITPLTAPGVTVITIFQFLGSWNEFYHAMVLVSSPAKFTIPLGMVRLIEVQQYSIEWGPIFAGMVIVIIPILAFFALTQKRLVGGLTAGGLKG